MKSSAHKALASLQHKYQALIKKHGKLKNEIRAIGFGPAVVPQPTTERRVDSSVFTETLLRDNIAELEATIERLEFDLRATRSNPVYIEDVRRNTKLARLAQNDAQQARSERDDAKQAVWIYSLLSFVVGVAGTYGTLFAYGLVPGIY